MLNCHKDRGEEYLITRDIKKIRILEEDFELRKVFNSIRSKFKEK